MDVDELESFLEHYGIKGMHWGVRRSRGANGRVTGKSVKPKSGDYKQSRALQKKPVASLSNKQLETVNKRLSLEQKYSQLNPSKKKQGQAKVKATIAALGTAASLYNLANSPAGKAAMSVGKRASSAPKHLAK